MIQELRDYLIDYGYREEDADEIHEAFYGRGLEAAVDVFAWADDEWHDYTGELLGVICNWMEENGEKDSEVKRFDFIAW